MWYLIVSIPDLCTLTFFDLHMRLECGSLSTTTPVSLLANEFDVRSILHGQVRLAALVKCRLVSVRNFEMSKIASIWFKLLKYLLFHTLSRDNTFEEVIIVHR